MNIDSVFSTSLNPLDSTKKIDKAYLSSGLWANQLQCLQYLALQILSKEEFFLSELITDLNSQPIHYENCKNKYIDAYLNCFNETERETYLKDFMSFFDPKMQMFAVDNLSAKEKRKLWEGLIRYFCDHYLDFQAHSTSLRFLFSKIDSIQFSQARWTEKELCEAFDRGLDFLLDYSKPAGRIIEPKVLFFTYLARLITQLERADLCEKIPQDHDIEESIEGLFEELYYYLLYMPYPVSVEPRSSSWFDKIKQVSHKEGAQDLQEKFVEQLIFFLKKLPVAQLHEEMEIKLKTYLLKCHFFNND